MKTTISLALLLCALAGFGTNELNNIQTALGDEATFITLASKQGTLLISPELGGKIIGITTKGSSDRNLLFTNKRLLEPGYLQEKTTFFNPGGDRCWIAPSPRFNFDADGNFRVPAAIDPGNYRLLESSDSHAIVASRFQVKDNQGNAYELELRREIELLASQSECLSGVDSISCRCTNRLINHSNKTIGRELPLVALKTFVEVLPPGEIIVALSKQASTTNPYVEYKDPSPHQIADGLIIFQLDGGADGLRQKLGFPAQSVTGKLAFTALLPNGKSMAIFRSFPVDPIGRYIENEDEANGKPGDAIQLYDDNGSFGGFAEMEELGPVKSLAPGEELTHTMTVLAFTGDPEKVRVTVERLLRGD